MNFSIILLLIILVTPVGNLGLKYLEKDYLNQQNIIKIDNIIVLAGAENINTTKITNKLNLNGSSERLIASVKLSLENPNSNIYFLGGDGNLVKNQIDESDVSKLFYKDVGFDINKIIFINTTRNTIENLSEFKKLENKNKSNVLITSAFHLKRAMMISRKLEINLIPYAVDFRSSNNFSMINFYQRFSLSGNLNSFDLFFRELLGILAFKLFFN